MKRNIDVFDFNEEDELAESASGKLMENFTNPSSSVSPDLQRQRIQSFCQDEPAMKEEVVDASCAEAATAVVDRQCEDAPALVTEAEESSRDHLNTENHIKETNEDYGVESFSCQPSAKSFYAETSSYGQHQLNSPLSDSSSSPERTDMMSAIDESLSDRTALSEASDSEGDEDWMAEHCFDDMEKIDVSTAVIMIPEYVVLKDMPCASSLVIFSCNGIKIKSYLDNNEEGSFSCEFGVEDLVSIQYNWYQNVGLIILRIHVLLKDEKYHENMQHTTDIEELKIATKDHNWPEKQQQINSLHVKYSAIWSADLDEDMEVSGENLNQRKRYFPRFDEPFKDVIYPKGDPDAVSICKRDVELLQPETFVNDTIIDFYINYLKNQIQADERQRFHFFNSFFFRKLADLDKDPSSIADGKAAFLRVRKWTRKVDMFGKDYIFVPVNFNLHWSLIIICHPGEVANCTDLDLDNSTKIPCILHMDSIKGSHAGLKNLVQSYLCEEWKERHKETSDDISSRFMNLRFVSLELPQQQNSYDCGLFLLHYLELFLAEAPQNFSPFKIYNASNFLYPNWFPPAEASLKRSLIEKLIFELLENRSREVINEENQSCESPVPVNSNNTGFEILSGRCTPLIDCNGNMTQTQDEQGIEMTLLERSSMRNMQAVNDSGMVLRDLFDARVNNTGSLPGQLQQTIQEPSSFYHPSNNSLAIEQVEMENDEQFMGLNSGESNFQRITELASARASISFSSCNLSMMPLQKEGEADSLSETSNDSKDIGIIEDSPMENIHEGETGESPSTQEELVVAWSQDGRDEEKQLENHLGIEDKTSEDREMGDKMSEELGVKDKTNEDPGTEDKTSGALGIEDRTSGALGIEDRTSEDPGIEENKTSDDLEIEEKTSDDLGIEEKTIEDIGDDCDQKEKEPMEEEDEKRAAKRPKLSSAGEVEEMEIN